MKTVHVVAGERSRKFFVFATVTWIDIFVVKVSREFRKSFAQVGYYNLIMIVNILVNGRRRVPENFGLVLVQFLCGAFGQAPCPS